MYYNRAYRASGLEAGRARMTNLAGRRQVVRIIAGLVDVALVGQLVHGIPEREWAIRTGSRQGPRGGNAL